MNDSAELKLRQLLSAKLDAKDFLRQLSEQIEDTSMPWEERRFYWYYLYNTGCYQEVWHLIMSHLRQKSRVPFDLFIEIAARAQLTAGESVLESLIKGLKKQSALHDLLAAFSFDQWDERLPQMRKLIQEEVVAQYQKVRSDLVEKFEFLQNERMTAQAAEVLAQLRKLYPEDQTFMQWEQDFKQQWAREIVSSHLPAHEQIETAEPKKVPVSPADMEMVKLFVEEAKKQSQKYPGLAYDIAICCWFFEEYGFAMEAVEFAPDDHATDWLIAELLLASRRYVECLEHINALEVKYASNPETTFSTSYVRAQALKKLGQHDQALEILRSIVHVRPNYRSAQSLILEWTNGARLG